MSNERLAEIKARVEAATPGPWFVNMTKVWAWKGALRGVDDRKMFLTEASPANAYFIANARTAIPELIAEVERLREHVASLEHAYKDSRERIRELESGVMF